MSSIEQLTLLNLHVMSKFLTQIKKGSFEKRLHANLYVLSPSTKVAPHSHTSVVLLKDHFRITSMGQILNCYNLQASRKFKLEKLVYADS